MEQVRQQHANSLALRAAISLTRLWETQGKGAQIAGLLKEQLNQMNEGNKTADLLQAQRLLATANIAAARR